MADAALTGFEHPQGAYSLRYPAHWETVIQEEGRSCGFGPQERDDVGLWISVLPANVDTELGELRSGLRQILGQIAGEASLANVREDLTSNHFCLKADISRPGEAGHYWLVAGGDLILFASTQVPDSARGEFDEPFDQVMASLRIHREEGLRRIQFSGELLRYLQQRSPEQDYRYDPDSPGVLAIRGRDQIIYPSNLYRRVQESPGRRAELIEEFVNALSFGGDDAPSAETLEAVRDLILPVPKPKNYVRADGPTASVVQREWLGEVVVCYAIRGRKTLRFVLEKDRARWGASINDLHLIALQNLERQSFPEKLPAVRLSQGRLILLSSEDGGDASRIFHPRLHDVFSPVLKSPFLAGIPDRETLVLFSREDTAEVARLGAKNREDYRRAAYPVSPELFVVGPAGIQVAPE